MIQCAQLSEIMATLLFGGNSKSLEAMHCISNEASETLYSITSPLTGCRKTTLFGWAFT
jgi:hypothetical protein